MCRDRDVLDLSTNAIDVQFFHNIRSYLNGKCSSIDAEYGMMRLEAFLYALDVFNDNLGILYGHSIGAYIYDSCQNPNKEIICSVAQSGSIVALIGPEDSNSVHIGSVIYSSFTPKTAIVTYGGTSDVLRDKEQYPNLFQTVPGDSTMVDALTDIATFYNWTFVAVLYSFDNMGNGFNEFKTASAKKGICIKYSVSMKKTLDDAFFTKVLKPLRKQKSVRVVFLLLTDIEAKRLFSYISKHYSDFANLQFIGGQHLGVKSAVLSGSKDTDIGLITLEFEPLHVQEFTNYYLALRPEKNARNKYFVPFWEQVFNCSLKKNQTGKNFSTCFGNETLKEGKGFFKNIPVMPVIDAVLALGHAVKLALEERCSHLTPLSKFNCLESENVTETYYNETYLSDTVISKLPLVKFAFPAGRHFEFDSYRRQRLNYSIYNTQLFDEDVKFVNIGTWRHGNTNKTSRFQYQERLFINTSIVKWRLNSTPVSRCGKECDRAEIKVYDNAFPCCWTCQSCQSNSIVLNNTCKACNEWTKSDKTGRKCTVMPIKAINSSSALPVVIIILVTLCITVVVAILAIYIKYFKSRPIKATSRELSLVSLFGLFAMFLTPLAFLAPPSSLICNLQQCLFGTSLTLCSVPLFLKALVIYRVVKKAKISTVTPKLSKKRSQMSICAGLILIQMLLCALWLQGNPGTVRKHISADKTYVITHCKYDVFSLVINFIYPCFIMALATVFALRTTAKKLPATVFEGKRMALTSALTCLIIFLYLASFTVFVSDKEGFIQEYSISFVYIIIGTINVSCIFFPRVTFVLSPSPADFQSPHLPTAGNMKDQNSAECTPTPDASREPQKKKDDQPTSDSKDDVIFLKPTTKND